MIIMLIMSFFAFFMIIISAAEFYTPRKNDIGKVRRGWIVMLVTGIIYSAFGIISLITLKSDRTLSAIFDYNAFFYICLASSVVVLIMSAIMISNYNSLRKEYTSQSPEYTEYMKSVSEFRSNAIIKNIFDTYHSKNKVLFVVFAILAAIRARIIHIEILTVLVGLGILLGIVVHIVLIFFYFQGKYTDTDFLKRRMVCWTILAVSAAENFVVSIIMTIIAISSNAPGVVVILSLIPVLMQIAIAVMSIYSRNLCSKYIERYSQNKER